MKRHCHFPKQARRQARARNAAIKAPPPQPDDSDPGEIQADLEDQLIDPDDFDADAFALVTDVQRIHCDGDGFAA